jgi:sugar phosphate isomerase/epimerase
MHGLITRRDFLERTAAAAAAAAVVSSSRGLAAQSSSGHMFISLNGAVAPRVGPWPAKAELAAKIGYGGVDWDFAPAKEAGVDATKALFDRLKIVPTITNLPMRGPFGGEEDAFDAQLAQLEEDAAFSAAIGCHKWMTTLSPASPLPKEQQRELVVGRLKKISAALAKSDVRLGLEFLGPLYMREGGPGGAPRGGGPRGVPGAAPAAPAGGEGNGREGGRRGGGRRGGGGPRIPFIWTLPETVALGKDGGENIGVILDVWHWHHSEGTIADITSTDKARIVHVHISDAKPMPPEEVRDNMRLMPGEGSIDLVGFLQALQKIGYTDGVSPEPLGRIPPDMSAEEAAKLGYDTTMAVMKKAGVI